MALPEIVSREEWLQARRRRCFLRDGDEIFHTNSVYARGSENRIPAYGLLDLTAFGRSEDWEEPRGRARTLHGADPTFTD
jgi:predicted dithiol-disulfide oxidoreductase (DUF899 family)